MGEWVDENRKYLNWIREAKSIGKHKTVDIRNVKQHEVSNIYPLRVLEGKKEKNGAKAIFGKIISMDFSKTNTILQSDIQ